MTTGIQTDNQATETIDGFQLVIDALKLNGVKNIYCVPGIPITDLSRNAKRGFARHLIQD
jgi:oxalyl-CoA decarboxylase